MSMALRITGDPIVLADLRRLVEQTDGWDGDCVVTPKGSRTEPASIAVEQAAIPLPLATE